MIPKAENYGESILDAARMTTDLMTEVACAGGICLLWPEGTRDAGKFEIIVADDDVQLDPDLVVAVAWLRALITPVVEAELHTKLYGLREGLI